MNSRDYERNPILLYNHDPSLPIGRALSLKRGEHEITADFEFAPKPDGIEGEWLPDYVRALVQAKVLRGLSIGFSPLPGGMRLATKGDVEKYGPEVQRIFSKWTLQEVSVVSVPANQDALITAVQKGYVSRSAFEKFATIGGSSPLAPPMPKPKPISISVRIPSLGREDISRIAREEIAKARGSLLL
jgi:HK97 family phage prohead protease